jgi:hypothetical protein
MKRTGRLFDRIVDYQNIRLAFLKAIRGNRDSRSVVQFCKNTANNLEKIRGNMQSLNCGWGNYYSFLIHDPKLRSISVAPIEQRIMHHAIMNVIEEVFERPMIYHSYACRKGKGTHAAVKYAFHQCKHNDWFLKLDVRKYFDSIDHDTLKNIIRNLIKDAKTLVLLETLIDSYETSRGKGVPIGNLTSQFFANLYLAGMDHFILEHLRPAAYCRYMDDFALWGPSAEFLRESFQKITGYAADNLRLTLKEPVIGTTHEGLPFLGFLIKGTGIFLLRKSKKRVTERMAQINTGLSSGVIGEEKAAERALSVFAAIKIAKTYRFRVSLCVNQDLPQNGRGLRLQPRETRRVLEQQRAEPSFRQPEQQRSVEQEQQPWLPAGAPLGPWNGYQPRNRFAPGWTAVAARKDKRDSPAGTCG